MQESSALSRTQERFHMVRVVRIDGLLRRSLRAWVIVARTAKASSLP